MMPLPTWPFSARWPSSRTAPPGLPCPNSMRCWPFSTSRPTMPSSNDIWITGLGAQTGAGAGIAPLAAALEQRETLAVPDATLHQHWVARAPEPMIGRIARRLDRSGQLFMAAAREAWTSAGLDGAPLDPDRVAVIEG